MTNHGKGSTSFGSSQASTVNCNAAYASGPQADRKQYDHKLNGLELKTMVKVHLT